MKVINVDENNTSTPVITEDMNMTRDEFSNYFRKLNEQCAIIS